MKPFLRGRARGGIHQQVVMWLLVLVCCSGLARAAEAGPDQSIFILLDTSGSMHGRGMGMAQSALRQLLDSLDDKQYALGLIKSQAGNEVVALGRHNASRIRSLIDFGHGSGNPATSLMEFHNRILPRYPGCHVVLLVVDGDDGANPQDAAGRIKNSCSRLFIVGVGLNEHSAGVLKPLAEAGGGRFCNGMDASALTTCIFRVFKRYHFDENSLTCRDEKGARGLNSLASMKRLSRVEDWDCYDFSDHDFLAGDLLAPGGPQIAYSIRGSSFKRANLKGVLMTGKATGASFDAANLQGARLAIRGETGSVSFREARMEGFSLERNHDAKGCSQDWDFTGAVLKDVRIKDVQLCRVRLSGVVDGADISNVQLDNLQVRDGLSFINSRLHDSKFTNVSSVGMHLLSSAVLAFSRDGKAVPVGNTASLNNVDIGPAHLAALKLGDSHYSDIRFNRISAPQVVIDAGLVLRNVAFSQLRTSSFLMHEKSGGTFRFSDSDIGAMAMDLAEATFSNSRINKARFTDPLKLAFTDNTVCQGCELVGSVRSGSSLRLEKSRLPGLVVSRLGLRLEALDVVLDESKWTHVGLDKNSTLDGVSLRKAVLVDTPLEIVMQRVQAQGCSLDEKSMLLIADGTGAVNFSQCQLAGQIYFDFYAARDLDFSGAAIGTPYKKEIVLRKSNPDIRSLNLSGVEAEIGPGGFVCRDCRLDRMKTESLSNVTFQNGSAVEATFNLLNSVEATGMDFSRATLQGINRGNYDRVNFNEVTIGASLVGFKHVTVSRSTLVKATLKGSIEHAEFTSVDFSDVMFKDGHISDSTFTGSNFARARFGMEETVSESLHRVINSRFVGVNFSGADFGKHGPWFSDVHFENCRFNGLSGAAQVKRLTEGIGPGGSGINMTNADLSGHDLEGVKISSSEWINVDLRRANLKNAQLSIMKMDAVRFEGASLAGARISGDLSGVRFSGADVSGLWLQGKLAGSDLSRLKNADQLFVLESDLDDVDLSGNDIHNAIINNLPVYRQLLLDGSSISCTMAERIFFLETVVVGAYKAVPGRAEATQGRQSENPGDLRRCRR